ncbi:MAG: UdgX family uracil-DNA binding protein [Gammaproteobacteria bacterium]|nr:UdgX family uracil-DNA binding protein [Gammaproteobacteria bacterium]
MRPAPRSAAPFVPPQDDLDALRAAAAVCKGCDLYLRGTQTVFGQGPAGARLLLIGEQPGDQEDLAGRPFIGPAGQLLDEALARAGIARREVYVTNAVKHFKWEPRGPRRLHKAPSAGEIAACRPWFEAEVRATRPRALVCLGVTAARAVFARSVRLGEVRGGPHESPLGVPTFATIHPAAILRVPERSMQDAEFARLVDDLRAAALAGGRDD